MAPLFAVFGHDCSGRDLILLVGGVFLIWKSTHEIHQRLEGGSIAQRVAITSTMIGVLVQIAMLDVVFSLDSVITAVGMANQVGVMIAAIMLAVGFMMFASGPVSAFVDRHPVVTMLALSFLLLFGAGLFVRSLQNLKATDTGFRDIDNLVTFQLAPALNGYDAPRAVHFYQELLERIRAVPGVKSAGLTSVPLLHGWEWDSTTSVEGHRAQDGEDMQAFRNSVSPGYFETLGIPILEGRDFDRRDAQKDVRVAIVNQRFARHYFGGRSAIGRHLGFGGGLQTKLNVEIVGVCADSLYEGPREGVRRQVFTPKWGKDSAALYVRTTLASKAAYAALRGEFAVSRLDHNDSIDHLSLIEGITNQSKH